MPAGSTLPVGKIFKIFTGYLLKRTLFEAFVKCKQLSDKQHILRNQYYRLRLNW